MRLRLISSVLVASTLAFAVSASAETTKRTPAEIEQRATENFKKSDLNNDGALSKDEFTAKTLKRFDSIDANHDAKITAAEMKTYREQKRIASAKRKAEKALVAKAASAPPATIR